MTEELPCGLREILDVAGNINHVGINPTGTVAWHSAEECPGEPPEAER